MDNQVEQRFAYRTEIIIIALLMMSTFAVYRQTADHDFVVYDDRTYILNNRHVVTGWQPDNFKWALKSTEHKHWHPITWFSHMTDVEFFGLDPGAHHMVSVWLHIVNVVLLFLLFRRMTSDIWKSAFVAAVFALHPLHVEPVAWISARKDMISTLLWLVTMWAYIWYTARPGWIRYALTFFCFLSGLAAKSMVVTLPFVLLLMDYWPLERFPSVTMESKKERLAHTLILIAEKAAFFLVMGLISVLALLIIRTSEIQVPGLAAFIPDMDRISRTLTAYGFYMAKMIVPYHLATPYPISAEIPSWQVAASIAAITGITWLAFSLRRKQPYLLTGWLWYVITLLPVSGIIAFGPLRLADRYTYIPMIGLTIMIAWGVADISKNLRYRKVILTSAAVASIATLATVSYIQVGYWKDSFTLLEHNIAIRPYDYRSFNKLGFLHIEQRNFKQAERNFRRALEIQPGDDIARVNLAMALMDQGRLKEAEQELRTMIQEKAGYVDAYYGLGIILDKQGRKNEAVDYLEKALEFKPDYTEVRSNLGIILARMDRYNDAETQFSEVVRLEPENTEARFNLAKISLRLNKPDAAETAYRKVIELQPNHAAAHNSLGLILAKKGLLREAVAHFEKALQIAPDYQNARRNLERGRSLLKKSEKP